MSDGGTDNIGAALDRALDPAALALLRRVAARADARGVAAYVVGGTVRDLLLGRPPGDLDIVVEGDAVALAVALAAELGGAVTSHAAFGTATLALPAGTALDLITARREVYDAPAALPRVLPAALPDDLFRRDFTINTLAAQINPAHYGRLSDLYGGRADLARGLVRVLHNTSFVDDPTRIFRAARLAARLAFSIEPHTRALVGAALAQGVIARTTPQRIASELRLTLHEPQPERAIALLHDLGALAHLHPALRWSDAQGAQCQAARAAAFPDVALSQLYLAIAVYPLSADERSAIVARYRPNATIMRLLGDISLVQAQLPLLRAALPNSALDRALHGLSAAALRAAQLAEVAPVPLAIEHYLATLRGTQIALNGRDLQQLGLQPGPQFRALLDGLRAARLDGLVQTRADEVVWVQQRRDSH